MIYKYKTKGKSFKDFRSYQNLIELFKKLRDSNINPKEVFKNQISFKPNLGEMQKRIPNLKSKDLVSVIQNVETIFDVKENY